jgi:formylglycine-generating enzyme required for sulfatase activity
MKTETGASGCDALGYERKTWPVCSKPAGHNRYKICDLAGNVFEWIADRFDARYYQRSPWQDPTGPSTPANAPDKAYYVVRGGSYVDGADNTKAFRRFRDPATNQKANVGIRCVRNAP